LTLIQRLQFSTLRLHDLARLHLHLELCRVFLPSGP
jgi:hypothetical protein